MGWNFGGYEAGGDASASNIVITAVLEKGLPGFCRAEVLVSLMNVVKSVDTV